MLRFGNVQVGRQTCQCQVGREVGFVEDAIKPFEPQAWIHIYSPLHSFVKEVQDDYHFEIPSMFARIFKDKENFQLFSEGTFQMVLESCDDYWNGFELNSINEAVEKKYLEFVQNATLSDTQVYISLYSNAVGSRMLIVLFLMTCTECLFNQLILHPFTLNYQKNCFQIPSNGL
jgi:hypothetical protein